MTRHTATLVAFTLAATWAALCLLALANALTR